MNYVSEDRIETFALAIRKAQLGNLYRPGLLCRLTCGTGCPRVTRIRTLRIGATEFRWTAELHDPLLVRLRVWGGGKNGCMLRADLTSSGDAGLLWGARTSRTSRTHSQCRLRHHRVRP
jgi:hypothetical protein